MDLQALTVHAALDGLRLRLLKAASDLPREDDLDRFVAAASRDLQSGVGELCDAQRHEGAAFLAMADAAAAFRRAAVVYAKIKIRAM
ncbi:MAG: hypothetical protein NW203_03680 [Hyphomonadaceae bacterium]|nr:hypothetical protein [Hyphomonadaceae bacterium]